MDARLYFHLADSIASAQTIADLDSVELLVSMTTMHSVERHALERALRSRANALRVGDVPIPNPLVERAD